MMVTPLLARLWKAAFCGLIFCCYFLAFGQDFVASKPLGVSFKEAPPFAIQDDAGEWQDIAVDLWRLVATDLKLEYTFVESSLPVLLKDIKNGELDVDVGAITVSAERENVMDFSQLSPRPLPYHES